MIEPRNEFVEITEYDGRVIINPKCIYYYSNFNLEEYIQNSFYYKLHKVYGEKVEHCYKKYKNNPYKIKLCNIVTSDEEDLKKFNLDKIYLKSPYNFLYFNVITEKIYDDHNILTGIEVYLDYIEHGNNLQLFDEESSDIRLEKLIKINKKFSILFSVFFYTFFLIYIYGSLIYNFNVFFPIIITIFGVLHSLSLLTNVMLLGENFKKTYMEHETRVENIQPGKVLEINSELKIKWYDIYYILFYKRPLFQKMIDRSICVKSPELEKCFYMKSVKIDNGIVWIFYKNSSENPRKYYVSEMFNVESII